MIKISHECPNSIFDQIEELTDYSYALVHLFDESQTYYDQFVQAKAQGREIILDNSVFELETAFDADQFFYWVERLKPAWYIIPDVLENCEQTVSNCKSWIAKYKPTFSKSIAVAQGNTYDKMVECYQQIEPLVDKVAISFDYSFFKELTGEQPTKYHQYMVGRQKLLAQLVADNVINVNKPHHLLGCGLPQEFAAYRNYTWIDSLDTSNPVVAGIKGIRYNGVQGLEDKPSQKLYTMINDTVDSEQFDNITYNIKTFREIVNG